MFHDHISFLLFNCFPEDFHQGNDMVCHFFTVVIQIHIHGHADTRRTGRHGLSTEPCNRFSGSDDTFRLSGFETFIRQLIHERCVADVILTGTDTTESDGVDDGTFLCQDSHTERTVSGIPTEPVVPQGNDLLSLFLLGSVFTVIPFLFQLQALRKLTAFTVNMAYNLEPLYSIAIAAILFGELQEVGFSFWIGICLIVLSVVLQTYSVVRPSSGL